MRVMNRRTFLKANSAFCAGLALNDVAPLVAQTLSASGWRTFDVTTRVELLKPSDTSRVWLPAAILRRTPHQRTLSNRFMADGGVIRLIKDKQNTLGIVCATFPTDTKAAVTLTTGYLAPCGLRVERRMRRMRYAFAIVPQEKRPIPHDPWLGQTLRGGWQSVRPDHVSCPAQTASRAIGSKRASWRQPRPPVRSE